MEEAVEVELTRGMTPEFYIAQIKQEIGQHMSRFEVVDLINIGRHIEELCEGYAVEFFANFTELEEVGYEGLEDVDAFKYIYLDIEKLENNSDSLFALSDLGTDLSNQLTHEEICWGFVQAEIEKAQQQLNKKNVVAAFEYILQAQKGIMLADQLTRCDLMENEFEYQRKKRKSKKSSFTSTRTRAESSKEDKTKCFELYDEENLKNPDISFAKKIDNIYDAYVAYLDEKCEGEMPDKDYIFTLKGWITDRDKVRRIKSNRQGRLEGIIVPDQVDE